MTTAATIYDNLFSTADLLNMGFSAQRIKTLADAGELVKVRRGAYCWFSWWESLPSQKHILARTLAVHKSLGKVTFSHSSAALLQGLATLGSSSKVHIVGGLKSRNALEGVQKHHDKYVQVEPVQLQDLPVLCTPPAVTALSCALTQGIRSGLVTAESAMYRAGVPYQDLQDLFLKATGRNCRTARYVGSIMSPLSESPGETLVRFALLASGLPVPVQQYEVFVNGRIYRLDFAIPHLKIALEFDGMVKYMDYGPADQALLAERQREKDLQNAGWYVVRVAWKDVFLHPHNLLRLVGRAVQARSAAPTPRRGTF